MGPDEIEAIQAVAELRLQVHGHDDFGMATANTLAAVEGGAGAVSATVNGLGERAGNAPLQLVRRTAEERKRELGRFPLFQELVEGQVTNLCCFAPSGRIVAVHQYRSLRRMGWEGNSILREATASTPELVEYAERLLGDSSWDGVAQVAFIVRERDGASWYMETNGRFWGSVEGSIAIGWDFPYWAYRYFTRGELPTPPPLRVGSKGAARSSPARQAPGRRLPRSR